MQEKFPGFRFIYLNTVPAVDKPPVGKPDTVIERVNVPKLLPESQVSQVAIVVLLNVEI